MSRFVQPQNSRYVAVIDIMYVIASMVTEEYHSSLISHLSSLIHNSQWCGGCHESGRVGHLESKDLFSSLNHCDTNGLIALPWDFLSLSSPSPKQCILVSNKGASKEPEFCCISPLMVQDYLRSGFCHPNIQHHTWLLIALLLDQDEKTERRG